MLAMADKLSKSSSEYVCIYVCMCVQTHILKPYHILNPYP
jgi:hypothetical protein